MYCILADYLMKYFDEKEIPHIWLEYMAENNGLQNSK